LKLESAATGSLRSVAERVVVVGLENELVGAVREKMITVPEGEHCSSSI